MNALFLCLSFCFSHSLLTITYFIRLCYCFFSSPFFLPLVSHYYYQGNKRLNSSKAAGYTFTYIRQQGNRTLTRREEQDPAGLLKGIYWIQDPNGIYRLISYQAHPDQRFRAQVLTNRPGEVNETFPDVSEDDDSTTTTSASLITTTTLMLTERPSSGPVSSSSHQISCSKGEAANGGIENLIMMSTSSTNTESTTETGSNDETTNESTTTDTDVSTSNEPTETTTADTGSETTQTYDSDEPPGPLPDEDKKEEDALRYFLEYRVFVDKGGSIYRKEGTDESGRVIGTYMFLVDDKMDNNGSQEQQRSISISGRKEALKPKIKTVDTGVTSSHKDAAFVPLIRNPLMTARLRRQQKQTRGV